MVFDWKGLQDKVDKINKEISMLEREKNGHIKTIERLRDQIETFKNQKNNFVNKRDNTKRILMNLSKKIKATDKEVLKKRVKYVFKHGSIKNFNDSDDKRKLEVVNKMFKEEKSDYSVFVSEIADLDGKIQSIRETITDLETVISENNQKMKDSHRKVADLCKEVSVVNKKAISNDSFEITVWIKIFNLKVKKIIESEKIYVRRSGTWYRVREDNPDKKIRNSNKINMLNELLNED